MIFLMQRKYIAYLLGLTALVVVAYLYRYQLVILFEGTVLQQYFATLVTYSEDFLQRPRTRQWIGWYHHMQEFHWIEYLTGRSHFSGLLNNLSVLAPGVLQPTSSDLSGNWYHNDFLAFTYNYGLIGLAFYVGLWVKIFRDCRAAIKGNVFVFLFFVTAIVIANFSGFYYYFTVFLMYMFVLMVKMYEEPDAAHWFVRRVRHQRPQTNH